MGHAELIKKESAERDLNTITIFTMKGTGALIDHEWQILLDLS